MDEMKRNEYRLIKYHNEKENFVLLLFLSFIIILDLMNDKRFQNERKRNRACSRCSRKCADKMVRMREKNAALRRIHPPKI